MAELVFQGGCFCGKIIYRVVGKPFTVAHFHCRNCRKASGAPFVTWAEFKAEEFALSRGEPNKYESESILAYEHPDSPGAIDITAGTMDDPETVVPDYHVWTVCQLPWIQLNDELPRYKRVRTAG